MIRKISLLASIYLGGWCDNNYKNWYNTMMPIQLSFRLRLAALCVITVGAQRTIQLSYFHLLHLQLQIRLHSPQKWEIKSLLLFSLLSPGNSHQELVDNSLFNLAKKALPVLCLMFEIMTWKSDFLLEVSLFFFSLSEVPSS